MKIFLGNSLICTCSISLAVDINEQTVLRFHRRCGKQFAASYILVLIFEEVLMEKIETARLCLTLASNEEMEQWPYKSSWLGAKITSRKPRNASRLPPSTLSLAFDLSISLFMNPRLSFSTFSDKSSPLHCSPV